jgi:hypothetical protein
MVVKGESNGSKRRIQHYHWLLLLLPLDYPFITIGFSFFYHWILLLLPLDSPSTTIEFSFYYHWILLLLPLDSPNPMVVKGESNGSKRRIQW